MAGFASNKKNTNVIILYIFAAVLVIFAAFLTFSLLVTVLTYGSGDNPEAYVGRFLYSVYGFSAFLIPAFLFACAIVLLIPGLNFCSCFMLTTSIIPFFTAYGGEQLIKKTSSITGAAFLSNIISGGLLISVVLAVITEYLLLFQAALIVEKRFYKPVVLRQKKKKDFSPESIPVETEKDSIASVPTVFEEQEKETGLSEEALSPDAPENTADTPNSGDTQSTETIDEQWSTEPEENSAGISNFRYTQHEEAREENISPDNFSVYGEETETQDYPEYKEETFQGYIDGETVPEQEPLEQEEVFETEGVFGQPESFNPEENPEEETAGFEDLEENGYDEIPDSGNSEEDSGIPDAEIPPGLFDGYIAGNFSIIDNERTEEVPADNKSPSREEREPDISGNGKPETLPAAETAETAETAVQNPPSVKRSTRRKYQIDSSILNTYPDGEYWIIDEHTHHAAAALKETLNEFNIQADVTGIRKGPVITMFEILPAPGVKLSKIVGLQDNIALRLAASSVRIVAPIPGKHAVGIEVPNNKRSIVSFKELIETDNPASRKMGIPVMLGKDITGEAQIIDLTAMPHLLIAGSTGSGKSVCVNSIILSILYRKAPDEVKLILIDPKVVELKLYNDIGHLLSPVITEPKRAFQALQYCLCEMERRYAVLDGMGVRNIKEYNKRILERNIAAEKLPYIVIIIDEFADLMATTGKELESTVARLAAMSRAVGIHLVLATQRPSIDVITGLIKANIPSRIAFMVASKMDSRIIIDQVGAEKLLGRGDMLYSSVTDPFPVRIQGAFVSDEEVERVVDQVKSFGEPEYIDDEIFVDDDDDVSLEDSFFSDGDDPLYEKALDIVLAAGKASASYIQRRLKIGYNRAARLVEEMEMRGIVGPANGSKPREVIHIPERQASGESVR